ncbi:MAG: serine/threonine protein kinase [Thermoflexales bacterium]|nr:serine/threonine protein kinase [Thermoflexales bacterium]
MRFQNPFFNRQRITDPDYFFGRVRQVEDLYSAIVTRQCRSLVGERKLGKSSLLSFIGHPDTMRAYGLDPERQLVIYFDLEGMASAGVDDFWIEVLDALAGCLPAGELAERVQQAVDAGDVRFMSVRRLLRRVRDAGFELSLCLDEFEALARNSRFETDFYGELRSLAGELGLVYLTASKRSLYDVTYEHSDTLSSPFFNIFSELNLGLMSDDEARLMLRALSTRQEAGEGVGFCEDEITYAINLAGTHPFFLQIAGYHLYETPARGQPRAPEGYRQVRKRFLAEAEDHYRYLWSQLSSTQQMALAHLSQASEPIVRTLRLKSLVQDAEDKPTPFSAAFAEFLERQRAERVAAANALSGSTTGSDLTGRMLGGYRVVSPIGRGGMAEVYKGYHPALDRYVALKVLSPRFAADETFYERFQREATSIARLRHSNIVQVFDFGTADNLTYMVMEYIAGPTLKQRVKSLRAQGQLLPRAEVLTITHDVANALDYAHARGLIHRDVKPANILLCRDEWECDPQSLAYSDDAAPAAPAGRADEASEALPTEAGSNSRPGPYAVLTDFGVVKMLEGVQFTITGMTLGTPDYMSPEQASGEEVTPASDIYALGVVVYEMLVGQLPFSADTPLAVLLMHMSDKPTLPRTIVPDLPPQVDDVISQALAKAPRDRFKTAGELALALEAVL